MLALAAVLVGVGYGPNTPSSSQILSQVVPQRRRALAFSLKQSGAPIGGVLAGLLLPFLVVVADWRLPLSSDRHAGRGSGGLCTATSKTLDGARETNRSSSVSPVAAMRVVLNQPQLRNPTFGAVLMMVAHSCFQTFYVAYLVEGVGMSLVSAGVHFAILQTAGAVSRVALGWLVGRIGSARRTLVSVSILSAVMALGVSAIQPDWPTLVLVVVSLLAGIGSSGFYGVFLAEIARMGTGRGVGFATGGVLFFVYWAVAAGPLMIAAIVGFSGSYLPALWVVSGLCVIAAVVFRRL